MRTKRDSAPKKTPRRSSPLVGTWFNGDEIETEAEYIVSKAGKGFSVRAVDRFDGEEADIFEVVWDGRELSFAAHWNSTGRFTRCRMLLLSENRISLTFTHTEQALWHRKTSS